MDAAFLERLDAEGRLVAAPEGSEERKPLLLEGERLHRELRPDMAADYDGYSELLFSEGARLTQLVAEGEVQALALWRVFHTTYCGRRFEVDDLVTAASGRSRGYGATLLTSLERKALALGCPTLTLNSATHRARAHRFYFRQGYRILGFHFVKDLGGA